MGGDEVVKGENKEGRGGNNEEFFQYRDGVREGDGGGVVGR